MTGSATAGTMSPGCIGLFQRSSCQVSIWPPSTITLCFGTPEAASLVHPPQARIEGRFRDALQLRIDGRVDRQAALVQALGAVVLLEMLPHVFEIERREAALRGPPAVTIGFCLAASATAWVM